MKMPFIALASIFVLLACHTGQNSQREVIRETREKRKAPIILTAKQDNFYFNLRRNNFFDYYGLKLGVAKAELYAGTYQLKGDTILLAFQNSYQPGDLTGKGLIDRRHNQVILFSRDTAQNRKLEILMDNQ